MTETTTLTDRYPNQQEEQGILPSRPSARQAPPLFLSSLSSPSFLFVHLLHQDRWSLLHPLLRLPSRLRPQGCCENHQPHWKARSLAVVRAVLMLLGPTMQSPKPGYAGQPDPSAQSSDGRGDIYRIIRSDSYSDFLFAIANNLSCQSTDLRQ